jgi:hypothetical protein
LQVQMEREVVRLLKRELQSEPMVVFLMQSPDAEGAAQLSQARRQSTPKPEPKRSNSSRPEVKNVSSSRPEAKESPRSAKPATIEKKVLPTVSSNNAMAEAASTTTPTGRRRTRSSAKV